MDSREFCDTLASKIADAVMSHYRSAHGNISGVDVFCADNGNIYVTDDTDHCSRVTLAGAKDVPEPDRLGTRFIRLTGGDTRNQWFNQIRARLYKLPILTASNGWIETERKHRAY